MEDNQTTIITEEVQPVIKKNNEFTVRAVVWGLLLGALILMANLYVVVLTGMSVGLSFLSAMLALVVVPMIGGRTNAKEINMMQTIVTAFAGAATAAVSIIPCALLFGYDFNYPLFLGIMLFADILGLCIVAALRKQALNDPKLVFPGALVCKVLYEKADNPPKRDMKLLLIFMAIGFVLSIIINLVPMATKIVIIPSVINISTILPQGMVLGIAVMPMLLALGYVLGLKTSMLLMLSSWVANIILAPIGTRLGWYPNPQTAEGLSAMKDFNLSLLIGIAVAGSLVPLIKQWKSIAESLNFRKLNISNDDAKIPVKPLFILAIGIAAASILFFGIAYDTNPIIVVITLCVLVFFTILDIRFLGETGLTVTGALEMILIMILGLLTKNPLIIIFMLSIAASMFGLAGSTMTDWKAGSFIGANQRKQLWCEFIVLVPGAVIGLAFVYAIIQTRGIGTPDAPFINAKMFYGLISGVTQTGASDLLNWARMGIGSVFGIGTALLGLPAVAVAITFYLPVSYMTAIGLGGIIRHIVNKVKGPAFGTVYVNAAAGFFLGDSIMMVLVIILLMLK
jgi:uncharacterized oligopeptide transporter (OPT) family protein